MERENQVSMSRPSIGEAGRTGDWRTAHPLLRQESCAAVKLGKETCQECWAYCPDACITRGMPPRVSLEFCKGCGICAEVCPSKAIVMVPEAEHGACDLGAEGER